MAGSRNSQEASGWPGLGSVTGGVFSGDISEAFRSCPCSDGFCKGAGFCKGSGLGFSSGGEGSPVLSGAATLSEQRVAPAAALGIDFQGQACTP